MGKFNFYKAVNVYCFIMIWSAAFYLTGKYFG
jgi:hypothetical protein